MTICQHTRLISNVVLLWYSQLCKHFNPISHLSYVGGLWLQTRKLISIFVIKSKILSNKCMSLSVILSGSIPTIKSAGFRSSLTSITWIISLWTFIQKSWSFGQSQNICTRAPISPHTLQHIADVLLYCAVVEGQMLHNHIVIYWFMFVVHYIF